MKINYNASAAVANKRLLGIEDRMGRSMERLSTGLKINRSKDNPAGMAISAKMQAQIDGLNRASQNASDGISVIGIADGALNEVASILQRMRELSVQAANDATMSPEDRRAVQDEIDSLKDEVNRISRDTEYNSKPLLDGSLDRLICTKHAGRVQTSDTVQSGIYEFTVDVAAKQAELNITGVDFNDNSNVVGESGSLNINGGIASIEATDTYAEAYEKIRKAAELGGVEVSRDAAGAINFKTERYGEDVTLTISTGNQALATALGISTVQDPQNEKSFVHGTIDATGKTVQVPAGADMEYTLNTTPDPTNPDKVAFSTSATVLTDGNKVEITDLNGVKFTFLAEAGYDATHPDGGLIEFEVTKLGAMTLHIGANMDQNMEIRIPEVSSDSLFIDDLDVVVTGGADRALNSLDAAISQVSSVRSMLGAYENRLDYSVASLDTFEENMTRAISRLTDADMAEEMTEYTHQNILNQAAISVLTQANDMPQQVLQILQ